MEVNDPGKTERFDILGGTQLGHGDDAGQVTVSPDDLRRFGMRTQRLATSLDGLDVDPSLLTDEVVGHVGLAQSLRDFFQEFRQRRADFHTHLSNLSGSTQQAGARYQDTDDAAADQLARLGHDDGSGKRRGAQ